MIVEDVVSGAVERIKDQEGKDDAENLKGEEFDTAFEQYMEEKEEDGQSEDNNDDPEFKEDPEDESAPEGDKESEHELSLIHI